MPPLRVLPRHIKPDRHRFSPCPGHRSAQCKRIEPGKILVRLSPHVLQQINEQGRADPPRSGHPRRVDLINERHQLLVTRQIRLQRECIPPPRDIPYVSTQNVQRNVLHVPFHCCRGPRPIFLPQSFEQRHQLLPDRAKQLTREDHPEPARVLRCHVVKLSCG